MSWKRIVESRTRRGRTVQLLVLTGAMVGPTLFGGSAGAALRPNKTLSCSTVSAAEIKSALSVVAGTTKVTNTGSATTCTYSHSTMILKISGGYTSASFASDRKSFNSHGEPTKTVAGLGSSAFSSSIGLAPYVTNTIVVLKGSTELLITVPEVSLTKVEGLAKTVLKAV